MFAALIRNAADRGPSVQRCASKLTVTGRCRRLPSSRSIFTRAACSCSPPTLTPATVTPLAIRSRREWSYRYIPAASTTNTAAPIAAAIGARMRRRAEETLIWTGETLIVRRSSGLRCGPAGRTPTPRIVPAGGVGNPPAQAQHCASRLAWRYSFTTISVSSSTEVAPARFARAPVRACFSAHPSQTRRDDRAGGHHDRERERRERTVERSEQPGDG